jgi:phosphonoacetate hydrolase
VLGDAATVFGELVGESEALDAAYRSHGSLHETKVPLVIYNAEKPRDPDAVTANLHLTERLMR